MKDELEHLANEGWHSLCDEVVGADATALVHGSIPHRDEGTSLVATTTSTYVRSDGQWRLSLSTRTTVPDVATSA